MELEIDLNKLLESLSGEDIAKLELLVAIFSAVNKTLIFPEKQGVPMTINKESFPVLIPLLESSNLSWIVATFLQQFGSESAAEEISIFELDQANQCIFLHSLWIALRGAINQEKYKKSTAKHPLFEKFATS